MWEGVVQPNDTAGTLLLPILRPLSGSVPPDRMRGQNPLLQGAIPPLEWAPPPLELLQRRHFSGTRLVHLGGELGHPQSEGKLLEHL